MSMFAEDDYIKDHSTTIMLAILALVNNKKTKTAFIILSTVL